VVLINSSVTCLRPFHTATEASLSMTTDNRRYTTTAYYNIFFMLSNHKFRDNSPLQNGKTGQNQSNYQPFC